MSNLINNCKTPLSSIFNNYEGTGLCINVEKGESLLSILLKLCAKITNIQQLPSDWLAETGVTRILNKPTIPTQYTDAMAQAAIRAILSTEFVTDESIIEIDHLEWGKIINAPDFVTESDVQNIVNDLVSNIDWSTIINGPAILTVEQVQTMIANYLNSAEFIALLNSLIQDYLDSEAFSEWLNNAINNYINSDAFQAYLTALISSLLADYLNSQAFLDLLNAAIANYFSQHPINWDDIQNIPIATTELLGVVKIGQGLQITPEGLLSVIPEITPTVTPCGVDVSYKGGASYPTSIEITLGSGTGLVELKYNSYRVPDKFILIFDGEEVINTGYVGAASKQTQLTAALAVKGAPSEPIVGIGSGIASFTKSTTTTTAILQIWAPIPTTQWTAFVSCPGAGLEDSTVDLNILQSDIVATGNRYQDFNNFIHTWDNANELRIDSGVHRGINDDLDRETTLTSGSTDYGYLEKAFQIKDVHTYDASHYAYDLSRSITNRTASLLVSATDAGWSGFEFYSNSQNYLNNAGFFSSYNDSFWALDFRGRGKQPNYSSANYYDGFSSHIGDDGHNRVEGQMSSFAEGGGITEDYSYSNAEIKQNVASHPSNAKSQRFYFETYSQPLGTSDEYQSQATLQMDETGFHFSNSHVSYVDGVTDNDATLRMFLQNVPYDDTVDSILALNSTTGQVVRMDVENFGAPTLSNNYVAFGTDEPGLKTNSGIWFEENYLGLGFNRFHLENTGVYQTVTPNSGTTVNSFQGVTSISTNNIVSTNTTNLGLKINAGMLHVNRVRMPGFANDNIGSIFQFDYDMYTYVQIKNLSGGTSAQTGLNFGTSGAELYLRMNGGNMVTRPNWLDISGNTAALTGGLQISLANLYMPGLPSYTNDAAAATAGLPVGYCYWGTDGVLHKRLS